MAHSIRFHKYARQISAFLAAACLCLFLSACGAEERTALQPGTYSGTGIGHGGDIAVQLVVNSAGRIASLEILSEDETPAYAADALQQLPKSIVKKQSLALDAVAGATLSSHGVLAAAADAIAQAGGDPKDFGFVTAGERADGTGLLFTGLPAGDLTLTGEQLKADYTYSEIDTTAINSYDTETQMNIKGVPLESILQKHGTSVQAFGSVTASSADGYVITIPGEILHSRDILIAFEINGEAVDPRFVVPEERTMYWVKLLSKLSFETGQAQAAAEKTVRLRDVTHLAEDYQYNGAACKAIYFSKLAGLVWQEPAQQILVTIKTADGLTKTERYELFAGQVLVIEGTPDAPLYTGPALPAGMQMKHVTSIQVGDVLLHCEE